MFEISLEQGNIFGNLTSEQGVFSYFPVPPPRKFEDQVSPPGGGG